MFFLALLRTENLIADWLRRDIIRSMKLSIEVTEKDYVRAQFLHIRPRLWIKVAGIILLLLFTLALAIVLYQAIFNYECFDIIFFIVIMILSGFYFIWLFFYDFPHKSRKLYQRLKYYINTEYEIDENVLSSKNSLGNAKLPWDYFGRWRENKHLFILYPVDNLFHVFPKHCFSSEQDINDFRKLLIEKIGQEKFV
jgi:hypothetical protein